MLFRSKHDTQRGLGATDNLISCLSLTDLKAMRNQRLYVEPPVGHHIEYGLEIALLGPAHKTDRIIVTFIFLVGIIAPRPVGTRDLETKLFFKKIGS